MLSNINTPMAQRKAIVIKSRYLRECLLESATSTVSGQESFIALSNDNWTTIKQRGLFDMPKSRSYRNIYKNSSKCSNEEAILKTYLDDTFK